jgi:hypothetical protein
VTVFNGCKTQTIIIHEPLAVPSNCIFEKFTEEEKNSMIESVGRKIARNQEACRNRDERINTLIKEHNEAHRGS